MRILLLTHKGKASSSHPKTLKLQCQTLLLQVVINNAGVYGPQISLETVTAEDMLFTYQANTIGPLLVVQQLLKNKLIGKPGSLVGNVTSKAGSLAIPSLDIAPMLTCLQSYLQAAAFHLYVVFNRQPCTSLKAYNNARCSCLSAPSSFVAPEPLRMHELSSVCLLLLVCLSVHFFLSC